jgi:hypothetical protein
MLDKPDPGSLRRIHLIFKTHLDVGFTDFSARVVENYFQSYIPRAISLASQLRESGASERFIWTTGSWLIYEYLEQAGPKERREMEEAIVRGDITWHALPFTVHSENMDPSLFRFGLSLSQDLDRRFGRKTIAAKMTDVPGHTRGIVTLLAEAGVEFLHIGVNGSSTPPDVPPVFTWRAPDGSEVLVMYHKGSYGDLMIVPGCADAIMFAHTGDNLGPQSVEALRESFDTVRADFPGCEIQASTMDTFAASLRQVKGQIPVITQEIGDTWIHGAGTDPKKEASYRELSRLRREWLEQGVPPGEIQDFSRKILVVPEHTWGLDVKTHLNDWVNYAAEEFQAARGQASFQKMEQSWEEQRGYLSSAVAVLPGNLKQEAQSRLSLLEPRRPEPQAYTPLADLTLPVRLGALSARIDPQTGALISLKKGEKELSGTDFPLGKFWYETFSAADYQRFRRQYSVNKRETRFWAIPDFTKPGIDLVALEHKIFLPRLVQTGIRKVPDYETLQLILEMPQESWEKYGAPKQAVLEISAGSQANELSFRLQWFEKPACRLPEAIWFSFVPWVKKHPAWCMDKLGQWVSPYDVIRDGNRHLHGVGDGGVRLEDGKTGLLLKSLDTALTAPGQPAMLNFNNRQPDLRKGIHFNLYNNLWGTNFPMWYEEDALFRFTLVWETD